MGIAFDVGESQRQCGLAPFGGLALSFLIHGQDQGYGGGIQIQARHVAHFVDEEVVGGQFHRLVAVGFDPEGTPDPMDAGLGEADFVGQLATTPVSAVRVDR